jgi:hypothetical protein
MGEDWSSTPIICCYPLLLEVPSARLDPLSHIWGFKTDLQAQSSHFICKLPMLASLGKLPVLIELPCLRHGVLQLQC